MPRPAGGRDGGRGLGAPLLLGGGQVGRHPVGVPRAARLRPHLDRQQVPAGALLGADPAGGELGLVLAHPVAAADVDADGGVRRLLPPRVHDGLRRGRARVEAVAGQRAGRPGLGLRRARTGRGAGGRHGQCQQTDDHGEYGGQARRHEASSEWVSGASGPMARQAQSDIQVAAGQRWLRTPGEDAGEACRRTAFAQGRRLPCRRPSPPTRKPEPVLRRLRRPAAALSAVLLLPALAACGGDSGKADDKDSTSASSAETSDDCRHHGRAERGLVQRRRGREHHRDLELEGRKAGRRRP